MAADWIALQRLADAVKNKHPTAPKIALLLGTGLGGVAESIVQETVIPYAQLPDMPVSTAASHAGKCILGTLAGVPCIAFSGRLHCYEGYSADDVVVPVRLARLLGAEALIMGSAVGGLNRRLDVGDLTVIDDHINLMGVNPLVGPNDDSFGPRWPDMIEPYWQKGIDLAKAAALQRNLRLESAVYAGVLGPNLETRAEYRMLDRIGADIVGMSTVPEAIAAVHCGLKTIAFAIVTDRCLADCLEPADVSKIIAAANAAEPHLSGLISDLVPDLLTALDA
jgi:purine-nucleoside phosphorylase